MGTSELNERQPVGRFLGPAGANATTLGQPTQSALHHPSAGRELGFARDGTVLDNRFITPTEMVDMSNIAFLLYKLVNIRKVIAFVKTHVLLNANWVRSRGNNGNDHLVNQPFIMGVGSRHIHRQRRTALVDQNMNFATTFSS